MAFAGARPRTQPRKGRSSSSKGKAAGPEYDDEDEYEYDRVAAAGVRNRTQPVRAVLVLEGNPTGTEDDPALVATAGHNDEGVEILVLRSETSGPIWRSK